MLMVITLFMIWFERRVVGRMQQRPGPNWNGPFGLLQSLADGLKLAFKEDIRPVLADKAVFFIAPVLSVIPAFVAWSVIPIGPEVSIFGERTALQLTDLPVGILVVLACSSIGVYGIVLAGWASGSPYPLLGSLRSAAQVISYELALGLSIIAVVLYAGSLSTADIVAAQSTGWYIWLLPVSFAIFAVSMVGETNRAPFDLPEAESELVGGFHTEYSSLKFALFFLAEYVNMVTLSAVATTLFLGGWQAPWPLSLWPAANEGWLPIVWFLGKTLAFLFVYVWLRGTLPRQRYDQFMAPGLEAADPDQPGLADARRHAARAAGRADHRPDPHRRRRRAGAARRRGPAAARPGPARRRPGAPGRRRLPRAAPGPRRAADPEAAPPRGDGRAPGTTGEAETVTAGATGGRPLMGMFDGIAGFGVTFSTMFRKVVTEDYPRVKKVTAPRYHGRHQLNRHPDGLEKCVGCELCAWACPADAIYVEGGDNTDEERYSPGERYGSIYQINYLRCIGCGLCIEACPTRSLTMTNEYELADDDRQDLIYDKDRLLAPLLPGMEQPPHPMRLGENEQDYYVQGPEMARRQDVQDAVREEIQMTPEASR